MHLIFYMLGKFHELTSPRKMKTMYKSLKSSNNSNNESKVNELYGSYTPTRKLIIAIGRYHVMCHRARVGKSLNKPKIAIDS